MSCGLRMRWIRFLLGKVPWIEVPGIGAGRHGRSLQEGVRGCCRTRGGSKPRERRTTRDQLGLLGGGERGR